MEGRGNFDRRHDDHGHRSQMKIHGIAHGLCGVRLSQIHMGNLGEGMHARIGSAGADDRDGLAAKCPDRGLNGLLHRWAVRLALPADEAATIVFES